MIANCVEFNASSTACQRYEIYATSTQATLSDVVFGQGILVVLCFVALVAFLFNHLKRRKPWQHF